MAETSKSIALEASTVDRISSLPSEIIDDIVERISTRDAVRTSALSTKWRCIWADHPSLVLNESFFEEIMGNRPLNERKTYLAKVVNETLLQHRGSVLEFVLDVSPFISQQSEVHRWLLSPSLKDVREFTIKNPSFDSFIVPSCIFSFSKLTFLWLTKCIMVAPSTSLEFSKLNKLHLHMVNLPPISLNTPLLGFLSLISCVGVGNFKISAPKLQLLTLVYNDNLSLSNYISSSEVKNVTITSDITFEAESEGDKVNLATLLSCWSGLSYLCIEGFILQHLSAGTLVTRLPATRLVTLELDSISYDFEEITCIVCLLRSSPILDHLTIQTSSEVSDDSRVPIYIENVISNKKQSMPLLCSVSMTEFKGSRAEMLFAKLLLGCSPSLETFHVEDPEFESIFPSGGSTIVNELEQFPRASSKVELEYYLGDI